MYREALMMTSTAAGASFRGWKRDEYANNAENLAIYDVNTVANATTPRSSRFSGCACQVRHSHGIVGPGCL